MIDPLITASAAGISVVVLARAAFHKATEYEAFRQTLADYRLLPQPVIPMAALVLLLVEIATILLLVIPSTRMLGGAITAGLLLLYGLAMAINLARGLHSIDCGCGGSGQPISWVLAARNLVLATIAGLAALPPAGRLLDFGGIAAAAGIVLVAVLLLVTVERVDQTFNHIRAVNARG